MWQNRSDENTKADHNWSKHPGDQKIRQKKLSFLLFLPFIIYLCLTPLLLREDITREQEYISSAADDRSFGKYLYQDITLQNIITPPQKAFHYYYHLAETLENDETVIIIRYPISEKEKIQERLTQLPRKFRGRTDIVGGEAHEFLRKFVLTPYEDQHPESKLKNVEYYAFNIGEGVSAKKTRLILLFFLGGLLLILPWIYPYFFPEQTRVNSID